MIAHYRFVTLPSREFSEFAKSGYYVSLLDNPEEFQCTLLGSDWISFVCGGQKLAVWQCKISNKVFYWEGNDNSWDFGLAPNERTYDFSNRDYPAFYEIEPYQYSIDRFCHYIMGWMPNVGDYGVETRRQLCEAVREAFKKVEVRG